MRILITTTNQPAATLPATIPTKPGQKSPFIHGQAAPAVTLKIKMNSKYKKLRVYYAAKGKGFVKISKKAKVTLRSGDRLLFRFNDNKHRVKNEEAVLTVK